MAERQEQQQQQQQRPRPAVEPSPAEVCDIGVNLTNRRLRRGLAGVLRRAAAARVTSMVITGTSVRASVEAEAMARQRGGDGVLLASTAGVHPHDASSYDDAAEAEIERLAALPRVVAVGETGLDFNRMHSPREVQIEAFRRQVALAVRLRMPLFLHEREAHGALLDVLRPHLERGELPPACVHCFTGTEEEAREYVRLGLYVGVTTFVCKRNRGAALREALAAGALPLERLMLETDAPFMLPDGVPRGALAGGRNVNEPCTLPLAVRTVAAALGVQPDEVARATHANSVAIFGLDRL